MAQQAKERTQGSGKPDYTIHAVQNALRVLKAFKTDPTGLTLTDISTATGLSKSMTLRNLFTLEKEGFVSYDPDKKKYTLGLELFELGNARFNSISWRKIAAKKLRKLSNDTGMICYLGVREEQKIVMLEKIFPITTPTWAQLMVQTGGTSEMYSTGIGRLFLSRYTEEELEAYFRQISLQSFTSTTIVDKAELLEIIRRAGEEDIAYNMGENEVYIHSICCPIFDNTGTMIAGISICGMQDVIEGEDRPKYVALLKATADAISREIGYRSDAEN